MSSSSDELRPSGDEPFSNGRLDSWKEIASYLRRSVRSAKRWEKEEGLPVHRHLHGKRDSVYGYGKELDAWWKSRGVKLADQNGAEEDDSGVEEPERQEVAPSSSPAPRRAALIGVGFALAIVLVGVVAWLSRNGSSPSAGSLRQPLPFSARDWVLSSSSIHARPSHAGGGSGGLGSGRTRSVDEQAAARGIRPLTESILVDTGPIVALLNGRDRYRERS